MDYKKPDWTAIFSGGSLSVGSNHFGDSRRKSNYYWILIKSIQNDIKTW